MSSDFCIKCDNVLAEVCFECAQDVHSEATSQLAKALGLRAGKHLPKTVIEKAAQKIESLETQLQRTREAIKLVAEERDAARETALRPSQWLLKEGNELVRKFNAIRELVAKNNEHPLASQINDVLNGNP